MRRGWVTVLLLLAVLVLAVLPLALGLGSGAEPFTGSDTRATTTITEIDPDYEPWFAPLTELPSAEVESGLFALQAALGAGVLGYVFGVLRTRQKVRAATAPRAAAAPPDVAG